MSEYKTLKDKVNNKLQLNIIILEGEISMFFAYKNPNTNLQNPSNPLEARPNTHSKHFPTFNHG